MQTEKKEPKAPSSLVLDYILPCEIQLMQLLRGEENMPI
jgi:hypothetical protein